MQFVIENQAVLTLATLALFALLLGAVLMRRPARETPQGDELARTVERLAAAEAQRDSLRAELEGQRVACGRLEAERDALRMQVSTLEKDLEIETRRLAERSSEVSALKIVESRLSGERDTLTAECTKVIKAYEAQEAKLRAETEALRAREAEIATLRGDLRAADETLRAEREKHAALREETERNREQFVAQFKAISGEILQNQGKAATEAQKSELEKVINPFKAEIEGLKTNLRDITDKAEKERQGLGTQLLLMQSRAAELAEQANGLAQALRGEKKKQGNWGETILERILEAAGLQEGPHFTRQASMTDGDGNRLIPDIVVHLPGARDVVIDSKVTLVAYQDLVQAGDAETEAAALKRHVQAVRTHVRSLSGKSYDGLGYGTVDSVMMFLPVEGALTAALAAEPDLVIEAAEKRVHLMTPATLMPTLKIVDHLWTIDTRNRNVEDIVDSAGRLHDKFVSVVESLQKIGDHLRRASDCHEDALKQMSEGRGNVLRQVEQLQLMGAKTRKSLPADLLAASDDAAEDETAERPAEPEPMVLAAG